MENYRLEAVVNTELEGVAVHVETNVAELVVTLLNLTEAEATERSHESHTVRSSILDTRTDTDTPLCSVVVSFFNTCDYVVSVATVLDVVRLNADASAEVYEETYLTSLSESVTSVRVHSEFVRALTVLVRNETLLECDSEIPVVVEGIAELRSDRERSGFKLTQRSVKVLIVETEATAYPKLCVS